MSYCSTEAVRRWRAANPERAKEQNRRTYEKHRETIIARSKAWQVANPEKTAESKRKSALAWHHKNRERSLDKARRWRKANPEKVLFNTRKRRARKLANGGQCTQEQMEARFSMFGHRCVYCGATESLTPDHMIPLSRGGTDWPANIVPACLDCNRRKHAMSYFEFIERIA